MNTFDSNDFLTIADSLKKKGLNYEEITLQLRQHGAPDNLLQETIDRIKSLSLLRKRNSGFLCCGIGVVLLVVGCMLTLLLFSNGNIKFVMYGLTTIGVIFTLKGLVDLMGW
ncbi:MAG: hypothetical protein WBC06_01730 [Chitinophagaceae bacterium]